VCLSGSCNTAGDGNCDGLAGDGCAFVGALADCTDSGRCVVASESPPPPPPPPPGKRTVVESGLPAQLKKRQGGLGICDTQCLNPFVQFAGKTITLVLICILTVRIT
jgi:hypothetical protein